MHTHPAPFPPPEITNTGLSITATDYFTGPWHAARLPYLSNHRGILRLLTPYQPWRDMLQSSFAPPLVITRGTLPCGCDSIELFFEKPRHQSIIIPAHHANRLPSDPHGKRPWELEFWLSPSPGYMGPHSRFTAAWRAAPIPCLLPWNGWFPDPTQYPPRPHPRAPLFPFYYRKPVKNGRRMEPEPHIPPPHHQAWRWTEADGRQAPHVPPLFHNCQSM